MSCFVYADILAEFKRFLEWETQSFIGWESIEIFMAEALSDAWILARPNDAIIFEKRAFKERVDRASGKWLEKQTEDDTYKILLSTNMCKTIHALTSTFVHEVRHCLDYQNAVKQFCFASFRPGNEFYNNWSEFRAVYSQTRYEYIARCSERPNEARDIFFILAELLGRRTADSVAGLMGSGDDLSKCLYYISRYVGGLRAVRNLSNEAQLDTYVFQLWNMIPEYITENFGDVFYLGNEWEETEICELNATPKTHYYGNLVNRITKNSISPS